MADFVLPFVIHWHGEPEPDLSAISDPVRVPFIFEGPEYTSEDAFVEAPIQLIAEADSHTHKTSRDNDRGPDT